MRAPILAYKVTPKGAYGFDRGDDVVHYGVDLGAAPGTPVHAPEDLEVIYFAVDNQTKPLSGYGPGAILARGASGVYHVIGHLDAWSWSGMMKSLLPYVGRTYKEGDLIGFVSKLNHVHWEIRDTPTPAGGADRAAHTIDPIAWLRGERTSATTAPVKSDQSGAWIVIILVAIALMKGDS